MLLDLDLLPGAKTEYDTRGTCGEYIVVGTGSG